MKLRMLGLSIVCITAINASESLGTIDVEEKIDTTIVKDSAYVHTDNNFTTNYKTKFGGYKNG